MKKRISLFLSVLLICVYASTTINAATIFTYEGYSYTFLTNGMASICGWDNSDSNFVVPDQVAGSFVFEVDRNGMQDNTVITSIDLTQATKLNTIGGYAFEGCSSVVGTLLLPRRVGFIGDAAFMNCESIEGLIYDSLTDTISRQCFRNCYLLRDVVISNGPSSIEAYAFQNCGSLEAITIPKSIISINSTAFSNCGDFVIYCYTNSYAHQYAEDKGIEYVLLDAPAPTEPVTEPATEPVTEPATEPATQAETVAPTEAQEYVLLGDADSDDEISVIDATLIQRLLADIQTPPLNLKAADVDGEGLDVIDATYIQRYLALITTPYPIGERVWR